MTILKGKLKPKQPTILTDDQWHDILLIGQLPLNYDKEKLFVTKNTLLLVFFNEMYFGLDLFENITYKDNKNFQQYQYKLEINKSEFLLVKINSIQDKYKLCYYKG